MYILILVDNIATWDDMNCTATLCLCFPPMSLPRVYQGCCSLPFEFAKVAVVSLRVLIALKPFVKFYNGYQVRDEY